MKIYFVLAVALLTLQGVIGQRGLIAKLKENRLNRKSSTKIVAQAAEVPYDEFDESDDQSCEIGFEGIYMTLNQKNKEDRILLDGSLKGNVRPGRMLAIMGPSGAGKSTACLALAGKVPYSKKVSLVGNRYLNGCQIASDSELPAAFVKQEDNFFPYMTVRETIAFRVELKYGRSMNRKDRNKMVNELIEQLSLTKAADTIVGNVKVRGISGGEKKRLSIACEMIDSPKIIFLDEPTSGLDSYQAYQVVKTLRKLADSGKTIIAVIHQPSQQVFSTFDDLLLLSDGRQMYFGEVQNARKYFQDLGFESHKEIGTAEFVIDLISKASENDDAYESSIKRLDFIAAAAKKSSKANQLLLDCSKEETRKRFNVGRKRASNIFTQFKLLFMRSLKETFRGKATILIKAVQQVTTALVYGGIYKLGLNQASIMDRIGLLSLIAIGTMNLSMASTIRSFPKEKAIVTSEISSKLYNTFPYFISKAIAEIPLIAGLSALFGSILYPLVGLQQGRFQNFLFLTSLHSIASQSAGLLIGSVSPSSDVSLALFPPIVVLSIIFDGKNIAAESVPKALKFLPKIGLVRWAYEGMCVNEFTGLTLEKDGPFRGPVLKTGEDALMRFGLEEASVERSVSNLLTLTSVSWLLSFLGLSATKDKFLPMEPIDL